MISFIAATEQKWMRRNKMREILFNGKRKDNGEWVEGHLFWYEDGRARIIPRHTDIFCYENDENTIQTLAYEVIPETVGQYTGLTDKNGKKIFEGDIVKVCRGKDIEKGIVYYDERIGTYAVLYNDENINLFFDIFTSKDPNVYIEIIGNIYDNPELLKETDNE